MRHFWMGLCVAILAACPSHGQNQRDIAVRKDKEDLSKQTEWIYDDLDAGIEEAARSKRPLMIVFR